MTDAGGLGRYARAVREHWVYVAASVVLAVAAAAILVRATEPRYEAGADVLVAPVGSDTLLGLPLLREHFTGRSVVTAARLAKSPQVSARARAALALPHAPTVTVTPQEQSNIITITGSSSSAVEAAAIANAFADALLAERTERFQLELRRFIDRLSGRLRELGGRSESAEASAVSSRLADYRALVGDRDPTLEIISRAVPPGAAVSPRPLLSIGVALMVGLLLGIGIAVALELVNPLVMRAETLSEPGGPPLLARTPRLTDDDVRLALSDPRALPADITAPVRTLWSNLPARRPSSDTGRMVVFTSPSRDDTSTAVAAVLAGSMALSGQRVVLIDADLERGPLGRIVNGDDPSVADLNEVLEADRASLVPAIAHPISANRRCRVLLSRPDEGDSSQWLPPDRLAALVVLLKTQVDMVVISAPPLPSAETVVLTDVADATVITVAVGRTRRDQLASLRYDLAERTITPHGYVVLDRRPSLLSRVARYSARPATVGRRAEAPKPSRR